MRRFIDVVVSVTAILMLAPLLTVIAVWVKVSSRGPVIFRQERVGREGVPFEILKFRTMRSEDGPLITSGHDPRITPAGHVLRRLKLDELPQLLNVLRGDMSIVGPRPEVPAYVALWPEAERAVILSVRPGVTDPASVEFIDESSLLTDSADPEALYVEEILPQKVALYVDYVAHRTIRTDLALVAATARAVLGKGRA